MSGLVGQSGAGGWRCFLSECYLICQAGGGRSWGCFATEEFFDDPGSWVGQNSGEGDESKRNSDWEGCSVETRDAAEFCFFTSKAVIGSCGSASANTDDFIGRSPSDLGFAVISASKNVSTPTAHPSH
ncbi:uncharacterized protein MONOS_18066 [Monocercomonoides exilis]|uniref:uncharacterized protein n=1 Tax=Monocercomonoides exilis TaxID=2049356 RepID=UPI003559BC8F|nr:hypothetical protein MONOS_18066 [Monocercomonoides exilis]